MNLSILNNLKTFIKDTKSDKKGVLYDFGKSSILLVTISGFLMNIVTGFLFLLAIIFNFSDANLGQKLFI